MSRTLWQQAEFKTAISIVQERLARYQADRRRYFAGGRNWSTLTAAIERTVTDLQRLESDPDAARELIQIRAKVWYDRNARTVSVEYRGKKHTYSIEEVAPYLDLRRKTAREAAVYQAINRFNDFTGEYAE